MSSLRSIPAGKERSAKTVYVWGAAIFTLALAGCVSPDRQAVLDAAAYPPDFTLEFFVTADEPLPGETGSPANRPAQHVVTPDRKLRAALGPGVSPRFHPPTTALLSKAEMTDLYRLAEASAEAEAGLAPISAAARPAVVYQLRFTAHGQPAALRTLPDRNPKAQALLDRLVQLRGGR
ncbi:MAG: hypothetical protein AAGH99_00725 [Planctomycetota bacterium]